MRFRTAQALVEREKRRSKTGPFEAGSLPDAEKERLCRSLLAEFGVTHIRVGNDGELIHGCLLPFKQHRNQEHDPTASLNYKKLTYKCLGCDAGGGLLWFIGTVRDSSGTEAREWLNKQHGMGGEEQSLPSLLAYFDEVYNPQRQVAPPIPKMNASVLNPWLFIHPYLTEMRHVPEDNLKRFKVGYGTFSVKLHNGSRVDSERIVFPHFWRGDLAGWQTRRLYKDGTPKFKSSPDFPKDRTIFNYNPRADAIVVESVLAVIRHSHHVPALESTFGASITDNQVRLLSQHRKLILWLDNDEAGWKATQTLGDALTAYSSVWVVENPWNEDAAAMDDDTVSSLIASPVPYALWRPPTEVREWGEAA